ncbi:MAG TPA: cupin domain-containing protein [Acidimicrobiales bacterium]|nr:cupin domain-containing protein [Acidimicrobiales bacterium]
MTEVTTNAATPANKGGYILVKADEGQLAFGSPHLFKAAAHDTGGRFDFIVETFAPRTGPPLHYHENQDDTFYVLEGVLTLQVGEEILDLAPGEFISIPPRMPHTFDNVHNGDEPVRAVNVMTPGGLFDIIEDMARVPSGPDQPAGIAEATKRHGTIIVGPPLRVTLGLG